MKKTAHGTLFAVPLPDGTFLSGRVMLDIYGCLKRRLFPADSPLPGLGKAYLIEMYSAISKKAEHIRSDVFIRGAFVESDAVGDSWTIVGNNPVNPFQVDFPESIIGFMHADGECAFEQGEIKIPLQLPLSTTEEVNEFSTRHSACLWPFTCLRAMGREEEIPMEFAGATMCGSDLRYSKYREKIYEHLPFPMDISYFEKQKQIGLNFERLYANA